MNYKEKTDKINLLLKQVYINFEKGEVRWLYSGTGRTLDKIVGSIISSGYRSVWFNGNRIQYHQVIFYAAHGYLPKEGRTIDHDDRNKQNNCIDNLLDVTLEENARNTGLSKSSTTGYKGIHFFKADRKWHAHIYRGGSRIFIGSFKTKQEAINARRDVEDNLDNCNKYRTRSTRQQDEI